MGAGKQGFDGCFFGHIGRVAVFGVIPFRECRRGFSARRLAV